MTHNTVSFASSIIKSNLQDSLLPFLSIKIDIVNRENETVNVLMDSGCQRNFILESLANDLKLETVGEELSLEIHGFTGEQRCKSRVVLFPVIINNIKIILECLCLQKIPVKMSIHHLDELKDLLKQDNKVLNYEPYYKKKYFCY